MASGATEHRVGTKVPIEHKSDSNQHMHKNNFYAFFGVVKSFHCLYGGWASVHDYLLKKGVLYHRLKCFCSVSNILSLEKQTSLVFFRAINAD